MQEETRHGVTIDWCSNCGGMWFDVEEIQKYLNARGTRSGQPVPKEDELRASRSGQPQVCTCCEEPPLSNQPICRNRRILYRAGLNSTPVVGSQSPV